MSEALNALQEWFREQCNGEWEHHHGISINSCDNPGWWVKIDLSGTALEKRTFTAIRQGVNENNFPNGDRWLCCEVRDTIWHGAGDETKLGAIVSTFLKWAATA
ncbi:MAG: immunity 53 family protein [Bdellovibrionota bacterium]